jgi:uncharacterized coiled-coil DUF342 family protein
LGVEHRNIDNMASTTPTPTHDALFYLPVLLKCLTHEHNSVNAARAVALVCNVQAFKRKLITDHGILETFASTLQLQSNADIRNLVLSALLGLVSDADNKLAIIHSSILDFLFATLKDGQFSMIDNAFAVLRELCTDEVCANLLVDRGYVKNFTVLIKSTRIEGIRIHACEILIQLSAINATKRQIVKAGVVPKLLEMTRFTEESTSSPSLIVACTLVCQLCHTQMIQTDLIGQGVVATLLVLSSCTNAPPEVRTACSLALIGLSAPHPPREPVRNHARVLIRQLKSSGSLLEKDFLWSKLVSLCTVKLERARLVAVGLLDAAIDTLSYSTFASNAVSLRTRALACKVLSLLTEVYEVHAGFLQSKLALQCLMANLYVDCLHNIIQLNDGATGSSAPTSLPFADIFDCSLYCVKTLRMLVSTPLHCQKLPQFIGPLIELCQNAQRSPFQIHTQILGESVLALTMLSMVPDLVVEIAKHKGHEVMMSVIESDRLSTADAVNANKFIFNLSFHQNIQTLLTAANVPSFLRKAIDSDPTNIANPAIVSLLHLVPSCHILVPTDACRRLILCGIACIPPTLVKCPCMMERTLSSLESLSWDQIHLAQICVDSNFPTLVESAFNAFTRKSPGVCEHSMGTLVRILLVYFLHNDAEHEEKVATKQPQSPMQLSPAETKPLSQQSSRLASLKSHSGLLQPNAIPQSPSTVTVKPANMQQKSHVLPQPHSPQPITTANYPSSSSVVPVSVISSSSVEALASKPIAHQVIDHSMEVNPIKPTETNSLNAQPSLSPANVVHGSINSVPCAFQSTSALALAAISTLPLNPVSQNLASQGTKVVSSTDDALIVKSELTIQNSHSTPSVTQSQQQAQSSLSLQPAPNGPQPLVSQQQRRFVQPAVQNQHLAQSMPTVTQPKQNRGWTILLSKIHQLLTQLDRVVRTRPNVDCKLKSDAAALQRIIHLRLDHHQAMNSLQVQTKEFRKRESDLIHQISLHRSLERSEARVQELESAAKRQRIGEHVATNGVVKEQNSLKLEPQPATTAKVEAESRVDYKSTTASATTMQTSSHPSSATPTASVAQSTAIVLVIASKSPPMTTATTPTSTVQINSLPFKMDSQFPSSPSQLQSQSQNGQSNAPMPTSSPLVKSPVPQASFMTAPTDPRLAARVRLATQDVLTTSPNHSPISSPAPLHLGTHGDPAPALAALVASDAFLKNKLATEVQRVADLEQELKKCQEESLERYITAISHEKELTEKLIAAESQIASLKSTLTEINSQIEMFRKQRAELDEDIEELRELNQMLIMSENNKMTTIEKLKNRIRELETG